MVLLDQLIDEVKRSNHDIGSHNILLNKQLPIFHLGSGSLKTFLNSLANSVLGATSRHFSTNI
jgi:hypothetical protein